jgi:glycosyltransferase involved in cell wall biosynthesis
VTAERPPILQVLVSTQPGGGPQHVLALIAGLRARGWRFVVAGPRDGVLFDRFAPLAVAVVETRTDRLNPLTVVKLVRLIRRHGVGLVHSHGKGAGLHGRLAARLAGVPAVHTLHGLHYEQYGAPGRAAYLGLERRLSGITRVIVNVSRAQQEEGLALGLFQARQSRVVVNGVDSSRLAARQLDRWDARAVLGLDQGALVIGSVARFDPVKQLDVVLRATVLARPTAAVALVGRGPEEARLRALAAELGLGARAVFPGEVEDAARCLAAFDVYAAPSRKEGLPLGVLEAMALGLPVVASDIAAHREVLGPLSDALVAATPEAFGARLGALLADAEQRALLGAQNRTRARSEFDVRSMLDALDGVYREVLGPVVP